VIYGAVRVDVVRIALAALATGWLWPMLGGCRTRPAAGAVCVSADQLVCAGAATALVCDSAAWQKVPCRGARGCAHRGDGDECDDTIASLGDRCPRNPPLV
jgi:hypothetical protein